MQFARQSINDPRVQTTQISLKTSKQLVLIAYSPVLIFSFVIVFFDCGVNKFCRVRYGNAHVVNNMYDSWGMYAIGGSESPTVLSEGNVFNAPDGADKQV